jgi:tetratricopeptide (TPR) repeat protein
LTRLADLAQIFPEDSELALGEGNVRLEYLGEGLLARERFEKAFQWKQGFAAAAKNVTMLARSAEEFSRWAEIALSLDSSDDNFLEKVRLIKASMNEGASYAQVLLHRTTAAAEKQEYGAAASLAELLLIYKDEIRGDGELSVRKTRAKCLRELDKNVADRRKALLEYLPPQERLSLGKAVAEMEEIIKLDEFDPEMWNFKSAWCSLLHRFDEADACADRALELRPHGYPKPILNKCDIRLKLKKYEEALALAKRALEIARNSSYKSDIPIAQGIIQRATHPPGPLTEYSLPAYASDFTKAAEGVSEQEIAGHGSINKLANGVLLRLMKSSGRNENSVIMSELTADFNPETVWRALHVCLTKDPDLFEAGITGMLYAALQPQKSLRRDATRVLSLFILGSGNADAIKKCYRKLALMPAHWDPLLSPLAGMIEQDLRAINPSIPTEVTNQPSITAAEIQQIKNSTSKFGGTDGFLKINSGGRPNSVIGKRPKNDSAMATVFGTIGFFACAMLVFRWAYGGWPPAEGSLWEWFTTAPKAKSAVLFSLVGIVAGGIFGKVVGTIIQSMFAYKQGKRY